jgi:hypothetical protein
VIDKTTNGKVALTDIPIGGAQVTARKIYRTAAAAPISFSSLRSRTTLSTTYVDNVADNAGRRRACEQYDR